MISTVIIDDEKDAVDTLSNFINKYLPRVEIVGTAHDVASGIIAIQEHQPDFILLDIRMPDGTGFDLLQQFPKPNFIVIFTTAFDQYAVEAFKHNAIDYLLKPIGPEELIVAVEKVRDRTALDIAQINHLIQSYQSQKFDTIALPGVEEYAFVRLEEILYLEADGNYTRIYLTTSSRPVLVTATIKEYEDTLSSDLFYRVHHSHIVNLMHVSKFVKGDGGYLIMKNDAHISVSRRKRKAFFQRLKLLSK